VSADKDLRKYILSEEEWNSISDIHEILQVSYSLISKNNNNKKY